jgi:hypothetical protein
VEYEDEDEDEDEDEEDMFVEADLVKTFFIYDFPFINPFFS